MPPRRKARPQGKSWTVVEPRTIPDWEAAHIFLEVARCGSFRAAADKLDQSVNALRRKVSELERRMGFPLFLRRITGVQLTGEGTAVYEAALQMEKASFGLLKACDASGRDSEGEVTLAITDGLGAFWLAPRLRDFHQANPKLLLNMTCAMKSADVMRLEADVAVRLDRPQSCDLKISKLGRLHLMFFAAPAYIQAHGRPTSLSDLAGHRFVVQSDDQGRWLESEKKFLPGLSPEGLIVVRPNASSANVMAVVHGAGIGVLPTYAATVYPELMPLDLAPPQPLDIWITYHADAKKIARVRRTIDWVTRCFDPRHHPWFRDEFIHPRKFKPAPLRAAE